MTSDVLRRTVDRAGVAARTAVLLPGTGSDEVFVSAVFAEPLAEIGIELVAPRPPAGPGLVAGQLAELDRIAAIRGPILAGGISLGAHLAVEWALDNPARCAGLLLALPGWHGPVDPPGGTAPAALAARISADQVAAGGVDRALAAATDGVPDWLAAELDRAWRRTGSGLATALRVAATRPAPTLAQLARIAAPAGVAACVDDPVHPVSVAEDWVAALPVAALRSVNLAGLGVDRQSLGRAAIRALEAAVLARESARGSTRGSAQGAV